MSTQLLQLLSQNPGGMTQAEIQATGFDRTALLEAAKELRAQNRVEISKTSDGQVLFTAVSPEIADKFHSLSEEHRAVYKLVKSTGNSGMWSRDLQKKSGMSAVALNKVLKMLESRRLVKCITPINNKTRKIWILFELEPSDDVSGGSWYSGGALDLETVEELRNQVLNYVGTKQRATFDEIYNYLVNEGETRGRDEIQTLVNTLEYDKILQVHARQFYSRRNATNISLFDTVETIPCYGCPVIEKCMTGGEVSPETCTYFNKWLSLPELDW